MKAVGLDPDSSRASDDYVAEGAFASRYLSAPIPKDSCDPRELG